MYDYHLTGLVEVGPVSESGERDQIIPLSSPSSITPYS